MIAGVIAERRDFSEEGRAHYDGYGQEGNEECATATARRGIEEQAIATSRGMCNALFKHDIFA